MSYTLKHKGAQIDELLDKAGTAVQPIIIGDREYIVADGLITSDDLHYYLPDKSPENDEAHTLTTIAAAKAYTDTEVSVVKGYVNGEIQSAKDYADFQIASAITSTLNTEV